jgi:hypothetical protein
LSTWLIFRRIATGRRHPSIVVRKRPLFDAPCF